LGDLSCYISNSVIISQGSSMDTVIHEETAEKL
jgi:hypothetical protein